MSRIKINDLPKDMKIRKEEMKAIMGGWQIQPINTINEWPIQPNDNINLQGVGSPFDGLYYITPASHSINTSGYKTKFSVKSSEAKP